MSTDLNSLMENSKYLQSIPPVFRLPAVIALAAKIAGVSADPRSLMSKAACIQNAIPHKMQLAVVISIANRIANT